MNRALFNVGLVALSFGGVAAVTLASDGAAVAGARDDARASKEAADLGRKAQKALARRDAAGAVQFAESAVGLQPQNAAYRAVLGQAYLGAGRFTSAQQALGDALALDPTLGKSALSLALAQVATGDWAAARKTLDGNIATIPAADRGLAIALAGDPDAGVQILMQAARGPDSNAKTRQNLALTLALSGKWPEAKMVASADLSPADVDKRMLQWATFAHPASASDQVSALLGVSPVEDGGQPVALAMNGDRGPTAMAAQSPVAVDAYMPGQQTGAPPVVTAAAPVVSAPAPVDAATAMAVPDAVPYVDPHAAPGPQLSSVSFGPPREVVQPIPARYLVARAAERSRIAAPALVAATAGKGRFVVQLGAYRNARAARVAWVAVARRHPAIAAHAPSSASVTANGVAFFRLSVGGFARADANALCAGIKAQGSSCFVRAAAGDRLASWGRGPQLAMR